MKQIMQFLLLDFVHMYSFSILFCTLFFLFLEIMVICKVLLPQNALPHIYSFFFCFVKKILLKLWTVALFLYGSFFI